MEKFPNSTIPSIELSNDETIYIELDTGMKTSNQNCDVIFLATGDVQILKQVGEKIYNTLYYKEHIIKYTLTLNMEHGAEMYEQH